MGFFPIARRRDQHTMTDDANLGSVLKRSFFLFIRGQSHRAEWQSHSPDSYSRNGRASGTGRSSRTLCGARRLRLRLLRSIAQAMLRAKSQVFPSTCRKRGGSYPNSRFEAHFIRVSCIDFDAFGMGRRPLAKANQRPPYAILAPFYLNCVSG
jgi:hypothetical protein